MATKDSGKVMMRYRGVYDGSEDYERLDVVSTFDKTGIYIALKDNSGVPLNNTQTWGDMLDISNVTYDIWVDGNVVRFGYSAYVVDNTVVIRMPGKNQL